MNTIQNKGTERDLKSVKMHMEKQNQNKYGRAPEQQDEPIILKELRNMYKGLIRKNDNSLDEYKIFMTDLKNKYKDALKIAKMFG